MNIDLAKIVPRPKAIVVDFAGDEIDLEIDGSSLIGKVSFCGTTERVDDRAHLRGTIKARAQIECTRCLEPVEQDLEVSFESIFVEATGDPETSDVELSSAQLDESVVQDGGIDLKEVVREQVLLAMPEHLFCREDCRGLCAKCGGSLNLISCNCVENEIDPRWSALKDLL